MSEQERTDLIEALNRHRGFLLTTAEGLTEEQARTASTVSALTIGALLKHVADTEEQWMAFAVRGADAFAWGDGDGDDAQEEVDWASAFITDDGSAWVDPRFILSDADTLPVLRERIAEVARHTAEVIGGADLDATHPLPVAPWFEAGASWSVRRVALHLLAEVSQHAGHADIIREAMDGQKTMG